MILQLILGGILLGGVYAIMAIGLTLIFGVMRIVNFAHGEFVMLGMYLTYLLFANFSTDPYISIFIVTPAMFLFGWLIYIVLLKKIIGAPHVTQIFVTVGLGMMMMSGALMIFSADFLKVQTPYTTTSVNIGEILLGVPQIVAFLISGVITLLLYFLLRFTFTGKAIRATIQNRFTASLMGINIERVYTLTFAIGVALTGLSASLLIPIYPVFPTIGMQFALLTFVVVVLGGLGSIPGALLGGLTIGIIETLSAYYFDPGWKQAVYFFVFILILVVRPQGFFGQIGTEEL